MILIIILLIIIAIGVLLISESGRDILELGVWLGASLGLLLVVGAIIALLGWILMGFFVFAREDFSGFLLFIGIFGIFYGIVYGWELLKKKFKVSNKIMLAWFAVAVTVFCLLIIIASQAIPSAQAFFLSIGAGY